MRRTRLWVGFLVCALLWAWTGCLILVPLLYWRLPNAHDGIAAILFDPSYLGAVLPTLSGAVLITWLVLGDRSRRGRG